MKIQFMGWLAILFVLLKLVGVVSWGWGYVLIPLWIGLGGSLLRSFIQDVLGVKG